ncbi:FAD-dependent monooxygenase [Clavibacter nebraskensis]|uniref:FAD-dependent oxidoreductase n=4 Tax=Clavibacter nebraskensis TaxID=31963 RepID=A0AAI8ZFK6_9MICO|nr:FAD-dependent monooxygenase [Clavibacter nebraskensis]KXU19426.1 monooxygenase [Clavibacter nebraskensis]OAH19805.1 monooxygenase [Clavibacter nebraskensis]QGV65422.1 FAD-dependent monooxygenase [Clavibacter nebraskensis]QGV68219.1 FAD-dependent monooxygenase [Clavibacter nebraskensis]QGV71012.1 FAD-dependent monooxygenase [Clavibacter nebraskensis]
MTENRRPRPRVLVTGASIAGPAVAWGLDRAGYDVTLLERSAEQRTTGQNIDIRGTGREIVDRMGIRDVVMRNLTGEDGTRYVDEDGRPYAVFPRTEGEDGPTAEIEILRGRFAGILVDALPAGVELRYGDLLVGAQQDASGVDVEFDSGARERFDLVVVAEGRSSRTRRILFAEETELRDFGVSIAYGTLDRLPADTDAWDWYTGTRGRVASIRPDDEGTIRASMSFESEPMGVEQLPVEAQLEVLRARFRGAGWQTQRILDGFAARPTEFYTQRMEQVVVSRWAKGRVVLLGDAAWGSGPTGMGTTLSLVGAYLLAGELGKAAEDPSDTPQAAFARYERLMRRYADSAQGLPPGGARLLHPSSRAGVAAMRAAFRVASSRPVRSFAQRYLLTSEKHVPVIPRYPALVA